MSLYFAHIYAELAIEYIHDGDSENAAIVARRAFHHAMIIWRENVTR